MNHYKTILAAIDLENNTDHVLNRAAELSKENQAKVIILHAAYAETPSYGCYYGGGLYAPKDFKFVKDLTKEKVSEKIHTFLENEQLSEENVIIKFGRPEEIIIDITKQENVDLIIMGSHGKNGLGLLLGSTANKVLNKAPCDVLAVRFTE